MSLITLVTKNERRVVAPADVLRLVVPATIANPRPSNINNKVRIRYFDPVTWQSKSPSFKNHEEAAVFLAERKEVIKNAVLERDVTVAEILTNEKHYYTNYRLAPIAVDYPPRAVPTEPRMLGLWLGDGTSSKSEITTKDPEILEYVTAFAGRHGLVVKPHDEIRYRIVSREGRGRLVDKNKMLEAIADKENGALFSEIQQKYGFVRRTMRMYMKMHKDGTLDEYFASRVNTFWAALVELKVANNKHIPDVYMRNSREVRLDVLGGLIDTDGHLNGGGYDFDLANLVLAEDTAQLARSLGFSVPPVKQVKKTCGSKICIAFHFRISGGGDELGAIPILLAYKRQKDRRQRYDQLKFTIEVATAPTVVESAINSVHADHRQPIEISTITAAEEVVETQPQSSALKNSNPAAAA